MRHRRRHRPPLGRCRMEGPLQPRRVTLQRSGITLAPDTLLKLGYGLVITAVVFKFKSVLYATFRQMDYIIVKTSLLRVARRGVLAVTGAMAPAPSEARVYILGSGPCSRRLAPGRQSSVNGIHPEDMELILNAYRRIT